MDSSPIILAHESPFSIGAVEISPATRELHHQGRRAILEPRVMQVLVALYRANGGVVSKDDLVTCCWGGRIVGDDAINRVIGRLRHEAIAHAGNAFRIETITRVGYRLVRDGDEHRPMQFDRRAVIGTGAAAAAMALGAVGWTLIGKPKKNSEVDELVEEASVAMRQTTPDQLANAVAKLRAASDLDPQNPEIWGALALAYQRHSAGVPQNQRQLMRARSAEARRRAFALDPNEGNALAARLMTLPLGGRWAEFERAARDALRKQPANAALNRLLASSLADVGRMKDAIFYLNRAEASEPMAVANYIMRTFALWSTGRLDEAETVINRAFSFWPKHFGVWFTRLYLLAYTARAEQSLAMLLDEAGRPIGIPQWNFEFTRQQVQSLISRSPVDVGKAIATGLDVARRGTGFAENVTMYASAVGLIDDAYRVIDGYYFNRGFSIGDRRWSNEQGIYAAPQDRRTSFLFQPPSAALRRDRRFETLMNSLGLSNYWRKTGTRPDYLA